MNILRSLGLFVFALLCISLFPSSGRCDAPTSISGYSFFVTVTEGGGKVAKSGSFILAMSNSGDKFRMIGMSDVEDTTGTYIFAKTSSTAAVTIGNWEMNFVFTNATRGVYSMIVGGKPINGYQIGTFVAAGAEAPAVGTNKVFEVSGRLSAFPAIPRNYRLVTGKTDYYRIDGTTASATAPLAYAKYNKSMGVFFFNDPVMGIGLDRFMFLTPTNGIYAYKIGSGIAYEFGSFRIQDKRPPTIIRHPQNTTGALGQTASLTVTASGSTPMFYQWYKNNSPISGATNSKLTFSPVVKSQTGNYFVRVRNAFGSKTSATASFTTACGVTLSFSNITVTAFTVPYDGATGQVNVASSGTCSWEASTTNDWVQIISTNGQSPLMFIVSTNASDKPRTGLIQVGNKTIQIAQGPEFAPPNFIGRTLLLFATNATGGLSASNDTMFAAQPGTNSIASFFEIVAVDATNIVTGSYSYNKTNADTAGITFGTTNIALRFSSVIGGDYELTRSAGGSQQGFFSVMETSEDTMGIGTQGYYSSTNLAAALQTVAFADFTLDGKADTMFQDNSGRLIVRAGAGTNITLRGGQAIGAGWFVVGAADFNFDRRTDILFQHTNGNFATWFMNGTNFIQSKPLFNGFVTAPGVFASGVGDLNRDRMTDIVIRGPAGDVYALYLNGLDYIYSSRIGATNFTTKPIWSVTDLNYDGFDDLVSQSTNGPITISYLFFDQVLTNISFSSQGKYILGPR